MAMGFFVYMTFWGSTSSDMFHLYPPSAAVDVCRVLLCISMLLTYPFPFLTVRELVVLICCGSRKSTAQPNSSGGFQVLVENAFSDQINSLLLPGSERQLKQPYHISLTILIWLFTLILALGASSLGSVLNLTGCATGTMVSFILPALFSFKMRGGTLLGTLLLILGGSVGLIGTYYSVLALF